MFFDGPIYLPALVLYWWSFSKIIERSQPIGTKTITKKNLFNNILSNNMPLLLNIVDAFSNQIGHLF